MYIGPESSAERTALLKALNMEFKTLHAEGMHLAAKERALMQSWQIDKARLVRYDRMVTHASKYAAAQYLRKAIRNNGYMDANVVRPKSQINGHAQLALEDLMKRLPVWRDLIINPHRSARFGYELTLPLNYNFKRRKATREDQYGKLLAYKSSDFASAVFSQYRRQFHPEVKHWSIEANHTLGTAFRKMVAEKGPAYLNKFYQLGEDVGAPRTQMDPLLVKMILGEGEHLPHYYGYPQFIDRQLKPTLVRGYAVQLHEVGDTVVTGMRGFIDVIIDTYEVSPDGLARPYDNGATTHSINWETTTLKTRIHGVDGDVWKRQIAFVPMMENAFESDYVVKTHYDNLIWEHIKSRVVSLS